MTEAAVARAVAFGSQVVILDGPTAADRIHIQRLGARAAAITPKSHSMEDAVAIMPGARRMSPA